MLVKRVNYCDHLGIIYVHRSLTLQQIYWEKVKKFQKVSQSNLLDS